MTTSVPVISKKKGFVYSSSDPTTPAKIAALNIGWFYNWNFVRNSGIDTAIPYTPMIWGSKIAVNPAAVSTINTLNTTGYENIVLGFNEPDGAAQSNLTVDQAIGLWPELVNSGRRIGSPAVAQNPTTPNGWLAQFMAQAKALNYRVDFITVHWYAPPNAASFIKEIDTLWYLYGLPIWITEFAVADWNATTTVPSRFSEAQVETFMGQVIPQLESRTYVERYCWKTRSTSDVNLGTSGLFNDDGSLTKLGMYYATF